MFESSSLRSAAIPIGMKFSDGDRPLPRKYISQLASFRIWQRPALAVVDSNDLVPASQSNDD
jgi:hypothetical protein